MTHKKSRFKEFEDKLKRFFVSVLSIIVAVVCGWFLRHIKMITTQITPEIIGFVIMGIALGVIMYYLHVIGTDLNEGFNRVVEVIEGQVQSNPTAKPNPNKNNSKEEKEEEIRTSGVGAFAGMTAGASIGLVGGPVGVLIGGIAGALIGNY